MKINVRYEDAISVEIPEDVKKQKSHLESDEWVSLKKNYDSYASLKENQNKYIFLYKKDCSYCETPEHYIIANLKYLKNIEVLDLSENKFIVNDGQIDFEFEGTPTLLYIDKGITRSYVGDKNVINELKAIVKKNREEDQ